MFACTGVDVTWTIETFDVLPAAEFAQAYRTLLPSGTEANMEVLGCRTPASWPAPRPCACQPAKAPEPLATTDVYCPLARLCDSKLAFVTGTVLSLLRFWLLTE